jgi:2-(1,2-epoxy-1,2-dihydrophenyl)acetyl-CoA isomerase
MPDILFERRAGAAVVTLNRPQARNAITPEMVRAFHRFLQRIERDSSVRCVLLKGAGEHFMAGGDVKSFAETVSLSPSKRRAMFQARVEAVAPLLLTMRRMPQILIAAVRGACAGAGLSWVAGADLAIAARSSFFVLAQTKIGVSPDGSGTYWLPRVLGLKRAKEIALLADRFSAEDAQRWGLVNRVVDDDALDAAVEEWVSRLAAGPATALGATKKLLNDSLGNSYLAQLRHEAKSFAACAATPDFVEGLLAFVEKRDARFGG